MTPRAIVVGKGGLTASRNMQNRNMASKDEKARAEADENMDVVGYNTGNEINHSVMDRMSQAVDDEEQ